MINLIRRLLNFSGCHKKDLLLSFIFSLIDSLFEILPIVAILSVLAGMIQSIESTPMPQSTIWASLIIMVVSILGRIVFNNLSCVKRTLGSFSMCSLKRLEIGEHLKRVPMGYFETHRPGQIAATVTTTLNDIETNAVIVLEKVAGGFIYAAVITLWLLIYEWHIAVIMVIGLALSTVVYSLIQKYAKKYSPRRQEAQSSLAVEILEYIKGMSVVKAFNMNESSSKAVNKAIEESATANILLERTFSLLIGFYQTVFKFAQAGILIVAPYLLVIGTITPTKCLLLIVASFMLYTTIELIGSMASIARVIESSLDRFDNLMNTPVLDENGNDIQLNNYDIEIHNLYFGYDDTEVLHDLNLTIPEKTTCAIIGPSGSGKTTLVNLIARFWDIDKGEILIGGHNVKEFTCESLLKNISMVFQDVYLFNDTIENNIKFGKPESTKDEIILAAKKACCHEFISSLPDGYNTLIGESGSNLSGGEKQRISIARAILKDAPIILLDEATANVDPENELELQKAISELTQNKTIVMIAHRLTTVRNADQIVVLNKGAISQQGNHQDLIDQPGIYKHFVEIRDKSISWKLGGRYERI